MKYHRYPLLALLLVTLKFFGCQEETTPEIEAPDEEEHSAENFYFGADLSYVNQILDHGGVYRNDGEILDPYTIFAERGTNLVRFEALAQSHSDPEIIGDAAIQ